MATLIDERPEEDNEEVNTFTEEAEAVQEDSQPEPQAEPELPSKYQGKSMEEVIRMHQEAEKLLGRQSSEVGELRKAVDGLIQQQTQLSQTQAPPLEEEIDFFAEPDKSVNKAIENHPTVKEALEASRQFKQQTAIQQLQAKHPDMAEVLQDPKFSEWIKASKIRTQLLQQADKQFDYEAADELFTTWKERQVTVKQTASAEKTERKQAVKSASTGNARGSGEQPKKIYRRSDIIKLMKTDPDRYQALSSEIMKAYAEGRVK